MRFYDEKEMRAALRAANKAAKTLANLHANNGFSAGNINRVFNSAYELETGIMALMEYAKFEGNVPQKAQRAYLIMNSNGQMPQEEIDRAVIAVDAPAGGVRRDRDGTWVLRSEITNAETTATLDRLIKIMEGGI